MIRKLGLVLTAMAVVAFAVPAMAGASSLTMPAKTLVPVGTEITALSHNTVIKTSIGEITCGAFTLNGKVTKNNGTTFEGVEAAGSNAKPCFFGPKEVEVTTPTLRSFASTLSGLGGFSLIFRVDLPTVGTCTYEETGVRFTYTAGASVLHLEGALNVTPAACGTAKIEGDYTVETVAGGFVIID